jgi:hypothetical protein
MDTPLYPFLLLIIVLDLLQLNIIYIVHLLSLLPLVSYLFLPWRVELGRGDLLDLDRSLVTVRRVTGDLLKVLLLNLSKLLPVGSLLCHRCLAAELTFKLRCSYLLTDLFRVVNSSFHSA